MLIGMLHGTRSSGRHVIKVCMPMEEWLEIVQSLSAWQACFCRASALMSSSQHQRVMAQSHLPLQEEGMLGFLAMPGTTCQDLRDLLVMLNRWMRWLGAELVGMVASHVGSIQDQPFLDASVASHFLWKGISFALSTVDGAELIIKSLLVEVSYKEGLPLVLAV